MESRESVVLYAEFTAKEDRSDEVEELLRGHVAEVRQEPGNLVFDAYRTRDDARRFFVFEVYRDLPSFEAHLRAPYGGPFNRKLRGLIVENGSQLTFLTPAAQISGRPVTAGSGIDTGALQA
jgi:quinol monooxygenase YgiN